MGAQEEIFCGRRRKKIPHCVRDDRWGVVVICAGALSFRPQGEILGVGGWTGGKIPRGARDDRLGVLSFRPEGEILGWMRLAGREDPSLRSG